MYNLFEKICRLRETVNLIEVVYIKKLWAFNTRQWDHEMLKRKAAYENKKLILGNSLVVIYSSATKVTSNTRTRKEYLFPEETIITRDRLLYQWTLAPVWCENMHGYLSAVPKCEGFCEPNSRKTVSFEEQTMSMDKFTSIFFAK